MNNYYPFVNEPLPYPYDSLEPYIDCKTMTLHHQKHLQTYIDKLNTLLKENPSLQKLSLPQLLVNLPLLPSSIQVPLQNNAGGVYNHRFFFYSMHRPDSSPVPEDVMEKIEQNFGSLESFYEQFKQSALSVFGSGYAWLVLENGNLKILTTANQNTPDLLKQYPVLNLDVWEHAYYLKYYNLRADYIDNWFSLIDWKRVETRLLSSSQTGKLLLH